MVEVNLKVVVDETHIQKTVITEINTEEYQRKITSNDGINFEILKNLTPNEQKKEIKRFIKDFLNTIQTQLETTCLKTLKEMD